jgi:copper homeostasis protein (lipoprotein)
MGGSVAATPATPTAHAHGPTLGALPASYAGLLPCADCAGIRVQINLLSGGAYAQRMTYLRDGHDDSFYDLGRWTLSGDGRRLTLHGRRGNEFWAVKDARTLRKLDAKGEPIESKLPYELARRDRVEPMEPRLTLTGMFRSMADAPRFRECRSGIEWPVSMSDDYLALERAYGQKRSQPGAELLVTVAGRVEHRPKMEGSGTEPTLIVERFAGAMPGRPCEEGSVMAELENNRWRPLRIGDSNVTVGPNQGEPWIHLDSHSKRVTGSGGCNRISGGYQTGRDTLRFGALATTQMACPNMNTESAFLRALGETRRFRAHGRTLELLDARGRVLVQLEERNLE